MYKSSVVYLVIISLAIANGNILEKFNNYTRIFGFSPNDNNNDLWQGIIRDCSKKVTFSCIQKNAYTYLDKTFIDRENITVFDGLRLTRNNLDYNACSKNNNPKDNLVDDANNSYERRTKSSVEENNIEDDVNREGRDSDTDQEEEYLSPLEEITHALRTKTMKFLATRDYQVRLPRFIGNGASLKISPREIDANGALIRIDFDTRSIEEQEHARFFFIKKIKKQIQNKLFMALLILILLIKLIKLKFMFVIPFLFGIGTAKKLFLKLLLFFVPAFAHVFKLCSSYYTTAATKYHYHRHKIAHHHHHIPVPVPVPTYSKPVYYDHPPPSHSHSDGPIILDEEFPVHDYAHPHIQYRKDIEELKEWGIEPYDESYDQVAPQSGVIYPGPPPPNGGPKSTPKFPGPFGMPPHYAPNSKPMPFPDKMPPPHHAQNLAYSGYAPALPPPPPLGPPPNSRQSAPSQSLPVGVVAAPPAFGLPPKAPVTQATRQQNYPSAVYSPQAHQQQQQQHQQQQPRPVSNQQRYDLQQQPSAPATAVPVAVLPTRKPYDDEFYGPIIERLDEIFGQLRFHEENCRERLVCSMYKNPGLYSPHSNLVSNELSRDIQELQQGNPNSSSSQRFYRYLNAAQIGQDGGDCLKAFPCGINTE